MSELKGLYPELEALSEDWIEVGDGHAIRYETSGNPNGIPVIFFHGGPASGCKPDHRRFFDPARYHVVLMDQRGCGRSRPYGLLEGNTTHNLLADAEAIREALGIRSWVIFGGSWGGTLALLYAQSFPERVMGLILRGTFLARQRDLSWYVGDGLRRMFPEAWSQLDAAVPNAIRTHAAPSEEDFLHALPHFIDRGAQAVLHGDDDLAFSVSRAWERFTGEAVGLALPTPLDGFTPQDVDTETRQRLVARTRIELHYAHHRYFIRDNQILDEIARVPRVPTFLIHGRRDVTCMPETSWQLKQALPHAELELLHTTGHLANEPENTDALIRATDRMAALLVGAPSVHSRL